MNSLPAVGIKNPAFLLVAIGPVQEFIAEARKTCDLWTGSQLLSSISLELIDIVGRSNIVFPALPASGGAESVPNQFFAIVDWDLLDDLTQELEKKRKAFLVKVAEPLKKRLKTINTLDREFPDWDMLWDSQLQDHFSLFWVVRKVTRGELKKAYAETYLGLQHQLDERKATRTFRQWCGSSAEKCYQCGHREVIGPAARSANLHFWQVVGRNAPARGSLKEKEKLCAVCLVKRLHTIRTGKKGFDSTSDLAAVPYKKILSGHSSATEVENFLAVANQFQKELGRKEFTSIDAVSATLLYPERLQRQAVAKEYSADIERKINTMVDEDNETECDARDFVEELVKESLVELEKKLKTLYSAYGRPSKYLVIMMLDADKMGEYMSGKKLVLPQSLTPVWQREQSEKLGKLSTDTYPNIINNWGGMLVYSGGDDLLALGPLNGSLATISALYNSFCSEFEATLSGSLIITHHQDSLRLAIEQARRSQELAKEGHDRDALVVSLRLSSGTRLTCGSKWQVPTTTGDLPVVELYDHFTRWLAQRDNGLAPSFLYDVEKDFPVFYNRLGRMQQDMFRWEIKRLLKRRVPKTSPFWDEEIDSLKTSDILIESLVALAGPTGTLGYDVQDNFESFLKIVAFLGRERKGDN